MKTETEPLTITVPKTCALLSLGKTKVYELLATGDLDRVKIGRRTLIRFESVKRLIAAN